MARLDDPVAIEKRPGSAARRGPACALSEQRWPRAGRNVWRSIVAPWDVRCTMDAIVPRQEKIWCGDAKVTYLLGYHWVVGVSLDPVVAKGHWLQAAGWTIEVSTWYGSQCLNCFNPQNSQFYGVKWLSPKQMNGLIFKKHDRYCGRNGATIDNGSMKAEGSFSWSLQQYLWKYQAGSTHPDFPNDGIMNCHNGVFGLWCGLIVAWKATY